MSSSHIIIVARNKKTGAIELPLEDMTLYGTGGEDGVLATCRRQYSEEWTLALYAPIGDFYAGDKQ